jgi:hypothetical protein
MVATSETIVGAAQKMASVAPTMVCKVLSIGLHYRCVQNLYQNPQIIYKMFSSARLRVLGLRNAAYQKLP